MNPTVKFKGGGSFVGLPPKFSANAETIYLAWKKTILGYSARNAKIVSKFKGAVHKIVGFDLYENESCEYLVACTVKGELIQWKADTQIKIRSKNIGKNNIRTFHLVPSDYQSAPSAIISHEIGSAVKFALLNTSDDTLTYFNVKLASCKKFYIDVGKGFLCIAQEHDVYFSKLTEPTKFHRHSVSPMEVTCVSCHPWDETILVGDSLGRATLWQGVFSQKLARSPRHWHTLPARCLAFSPSGGYFYTGGEECVLVQWPIDQPHNRKFLPRLPSSLVHIAVGRAGSNGYIALATADNGVTVVDLLFNPVSLIQHMVIGGRFNSGMVYDSRSRSLIMDGAVGQVQFYNPDDMSLLYKLDIVGQNRISNERDCNIENIQVVKIALSQDGLWMATVEERKDDDYSSDLRLKFWNFNLEQQNYELNTFIENPHEKSVTDLMFQPGKGSEDIISTTVADDHTFTVWKLTEIDSALKSGHVWTRKQTCSYKSLPCRGLSFAVDGSLLAVGCGPLATVWAADSLRMLCSLVLPGERDPIRSVIMGSFDSAHLLLTATSHSLTVWNLLTLRAIWTVPLDVAFVVPDLVMGFVAAFTTSNQVFIFSHKSPDIIYSSDNFLKDNSETVVNAVFVPNHCNEYGESSNVQWYQKSHLYFVNSNMELYCFGGKDEDQTDLSMSTNDEEISKLFHMVSLNGVKKQPGDFVYHRYEKDVKGEIIKKFLEAPNHTTIPIRYQFLSLLKSNIVQKCDINQSV